MAERMHGGKVKLGGKVVVPALQPGLLFKIELSCPGGE